MGAKAAREVANQLRELLYIYEEVNVIFAAAPSQNEMLEALCRSAGISWNRINAFHMDEYIGLANNMPQCFGKFLEDRLFAKLPFKSVHYINGNAASLVEECERYSRLLVTFPPHIVCMGIGENGHIAFNDPHVADFNDPRTIKVVTLDLACRQQQINDGCFDTIDQVPTHALTLTIPALLNASTIYCVVPGYNKAQAVYNTIHRNITEMHPATSLRKHPNTILFLDKNSSSLLNKNREQK